MGAKELVIEEGIGGDGIVVNLRMGTDPGTRRFAALRHALETLSIELEDAQALDRSLVAALHALSFHACGLVDGWTSQGKEWRRSLVEDELPEIYELVDVIFEGS